MRKEILEQLKQHLKNVDLRVKRLRKKKKNEFYVLKRETNHENKKKKMKWLISLSMTMKSLMKEKVTK
jgi:hypothetical protein